MTYKQLLDMNSQVREDMILIVKDDGTHTYVPNCPGNSDWDEYQEWLALGNTPDPAE